jgi:hypothetical protein
VVAARAAHHDAWAAVIDATLSEGYGAATADAGQRGSGDIESKNAREGTRGGVTVDMRRFWHHSFFLD